MRSRPSSRDRSGGHRATLDERGRVMGKHDKDKKHMKHSRRESRPADPAAGEGGGGGHPPAKAHGTPAPVDTSLPATRDELISLHAAARRRRSAASLGSP